MDPYSRAANHLSVGQIYVYDNSLLKRLLAMSDVKPLLVGLWETTPGVALPILRLNGYKIRDPTVLARVEYEELDQGRCA